MWCREAGWYTHTNTHTNMAVNQRKMLGTSQSYLQYTTAPYSLNFPVGTTHKSEPGVAFILKQLMTIAAISMMMENYRWALLYCENRQGAYNPKATAAGHPSGETFRTHASLLFGLNSWYIWHFLGEPTKGSQQWKNAQSVVKHWSLHNTVKLLLLCSRTIYWIYCLKASGVFLLK